MASKATCSACNRVFVADSYPKAKSARDAHRRTCVATLRVEYANATVTLTRQPDTGDFLCTCSEHPNGHRFSATNNLRRHVKLSKCHWIGSTEVRICTLWIFTSKLEERLSRMA